MKKYIIALIALAGCCFFISCESNNYKTRKLKGIGEHNRGTVDVMDLDPLINIGDTVSDQRMGHWNEKWIIIK